MISTKKKAHNENGLTRRDALRAGTSAIAAAVFLGQAPGELSAQKGNGKGGKNEKETGPNGNLPPTPFKFTPFTQDLPIPPVKQPFFVGQQIGDVPPGFTPGAVFHGIAPEWFNPIGDFDRSIYELYPTKYYEMRMKPGIAEIIPGVRTPIWGYDGQFPGPTFRTRVGEPAIVRQWNDLPEEMSIHLHGGHNPPHSDGFPSFFVLPGKARDYYYTNSVPREGDGKSGQLDFTESPSTMWYHDHAMDITSHHVEMGLSGFFLAFDKIEQDLIDGNVLPGDPFDIPIALTDRRLNADGTIYFDPLEHDGHLGDIMVMNGKAQPKFHVQRRKYRFRFLGAAGGGRTWELRLSNDQPFIGLGKDTWLFPNAIERPTILLGPANRADVVIDFTNAPNELFLENILVQTDGRGPKGKLLQRETQIPGVPLIKFVVEGLPQGNSATVEVGTPLRPNTPILPSEIVGTRVFNFMRRNGAWQINQSFWDPLVANACPTIGSAERWILKNEGGGWWHPIHIHLESHQYQSVDGQLPPIEDRFKSDTALLDGGTEIELFMKFRTFKGPFTFHCHNTDHEDMRMMFNFDPRMTPTSSPQPLQQTFP